MPVEIWRPPLTATFRYRDADVELIPLGPPHRQLLADAFGRLSEKSRYYRFMAPLSALSESDLDYLTDLDLVDRFAWGLVSDGEPAAVGRYARSSDDMADVGITVLDDYQGRGFGRLLVEALAVVAADAGFTTLEFEVLADNRPMLSILEGLGASSSTQAGVVHLELAVSQVTPASVDPSLLLEVVKAARSGADTPHTRATVRLSVADGGHSG